MGKKEKIALGIIALELILTITLYFDVSSSQVCSTFGLMNPFGTAEQLPIAAKACIDNTYFYLAADLLILNLIGYLIYLIIKRPTWVKNFNSVFLSLLGIEITLFLFFFLYQDNCGSACDTHSFLHPFGYTDLNNPFTICPAACTKIPYPPFYIITDLLIFTAILYSIFLIAKRLKRHYQT